MRDAQTTAPAQGREPADAVHADHAKRRPAWATRYTSGTSVTQVEADHRGEYVAIDVESGSWAISDDLRAAAKRLRTQQPGAIDVWLLRVGYRALHHFGGRPIRRAE